VHGAFFALPDNIELFRDTVELLDMLIAPPPSVAELFVKLQFDTNALLDFDKPIAPPHRAAFSLKLTVFKATVELSETSTPPPKDPPLFPTWHRCHTTRRS